MFTTRILDTVKSIYRAPSVILLTALVLGTGACSSPAPAEPAAPPVPNQVTVADRSYSPSELTVNVGDTVTWVFDDGGMAHDVVADDKYFRSPLMTSGSYTYTFDEPGTYNYHCTPHPDMTGTITVVPQGL